jgi:hypothetical protein
VPAWVFSELERHGPIDVISRNDPSFFQLPFLMLLLSMFIFGTAMFAAHGLPSRHYTLPISAATIVTWHLLPAMTLMFLETVASNAWLNATFHVGWPLWGPAIFLAVMLAAIDAVYWLTDKSAWPVVGISVVAAAFGVWFKSRFGPVFANPTHHWETLSTTDLLTLIGAGLGTFAVAIWAVKRQRRGDVISPLGIAALLDHVLPGATQRPRPFRSPAHAQFWFEWRRKGWVMPAAVLLTFLGGFAVWLVFSRDPLILLVAIFGTSVFGFIFGFIGGIVIGNVGPTDANPQISQFRATLPITTDGFAKTILKTAALSTLFAWGVFVLTWLAACAAFRQNPFEVPGGPRLDDWWIILIYTLLAPWIVLTLGGAVRCTGRIRPLAVLGLSVTTMIIIVPLLEYVLCHERIEALIGIALVLGTVWLLIVAWRRSLIGLLTLCISVTVWVALSVPATLLISRHPHSTSPALFIIGLLSLVVAPSAAFPLALACNRNR